MPREPKPLLSMPRAPKPPQNIHQLLRMGRDRREVQFLTVSAAEDKFSKDTQVNAHGYFSVEPYGEPKISPRKLKILDKLKKLSKDPDLSCG